MSRKLTEEEINELYTLCEHNGVEYYDLQIELVDHLASAIEQRWLEEPLLDFHDIIYPLVRQFGRRGFSNIVEEKQSALKKKYLDMQWKYIREFFRLPKIILTVAITISLFLLFTLSRNYLICVFVLTVLHELSLLVFAYAIFPRKQKINLQEGKTFLLYEQLKSEKHRIMVAGKGPMSLFMAFYFFNHEFNVADMNILTFKLIAAILLVLTGILTIVVWFYIPKRIKEDFLNEFPQFVKS
jgi:hypothetical protein